MEILTDIGILALWVTLIVVTLLVIAFFALREPDPVDEWNEIDGHDYTDQEEWR